MTGRPAEPDVSAVRDAARPLVADRAAFQAELDQLRVRERPTPARATRSPQRGAVFRWSKSIRRLRSPERTGRSR
jgi:hypothetical protein